MSNERLLWALIALVGYAHFAHSSTLRSYSVEHPEEGGGFFEGDIVLNRYQADSIQHGGAAAKGRASAAIVGDRYRWPGGVIPFEIASDYTSSQRDKVIKAMAEISSKTCISFRARRNTDKDFVSLVTGYSGCWSFVGRQGGSQRLNLDGGCFHHGIIVHELMHAISFWHEQSRTDRDNYVTVDLTYVPENNRHNFRKYTSKESNEQGIPYDFDSIMHYSSTAFVRVAGKKSIVPKVAGKTIGQREGMSRLDAVKINRLYCEKPKPAPVTGKKPKHLVTTRKKIVITPGAGKTLTVEII